jgi:hypothetical protein
MYQDCEPYKGNQVFQFRENQFVGRYYNADGDIEETKVCSTYDEVCEELNKYAKFMDIADQSWQ